MSRYSRPIDLTIRHDWSHTKTIMQRLLSLRDRVQPTGYGDADHYELKGLGTISRHRASQSWYRFSGAAIAATMPWLPTMLAIMKELGPDDGCVSLLQNDAAGHVDLPHLRTALNYVFYSDDAQAHTWVGEEHDRETYDSQVGTAWLLDTQVPHGITNKGERWTLSIHFSSGYDQVAEWFSARPGLEFGRHNHEEKR